MQIIFYLSCLFRCARKHNGYHNRTTAAFKIHMPSLIIRHIFEIKGCFRSICVWTPTNVPGVSLWDAVIHTCSPMLVHVRKCLFYFYVCVFFANMNFSNMCFLNMQPTNLIMRAHFNSYKPNISRKFRLNILRWNKHDLGTYLAAACFLDNNHFTSIHEKLCKGK